MCAHSDQEPFLPLGVVIRAVVSSVLLALVIVSAGCLYLRYAIPVQTPNGLGG